MEYFLKNKILIVLLIFLAYFYGASFAFQFEDYEWGKSSREIKHLIRTKNKRMIPPYRDRIVRYRDRILGEDCIVSLEFTPSSKRLSSVKVSWEDKNIGADVKTLLTSKYGKPQQPKLLVEEYHWVGASKYDRIVLDYDYAGTILTYYGGTFQEVYEREFNELMRKEEKRF